MVDGRVAVEGADEVELEEPPTDVFDVVPPGRRLTGGGSPTGDPDVVVTSPFEPVDDGIPVEGAAVDEDTVVSEVDDASSAARSVADGDPGAPTPCTRSAPRARSLRADSPTADSCAGPVGSAGGGGDPASASTSCTPLSPAIAHASVAAAMTTTTTAPGIGVSRCRRWVRTCETPTPPSSKMGSSARIDRCGDSIVAFTRSLPAFHRAHVDRCSHPMFGLPRHLAERRRLSPECRFRLESVAGQCFLVQILTNAEDNEADT